LIRCLKSVAKCVALGTIVPMSLSMSLSCVKSGSSSGGAESSTSTMMFTGVHPLVGKPGDAMTLSGQNLTGDSGVRLEFADSTGSISAPVTVTSSETATFSFPEGLGLGLKEATAMAKTTAVGTLSLVANTATNSLPIIIAEQTQVCSDITYINASGAQVTGTRDCSGGGASPTPVPSSTPNPFDIRKGKTVAGVAGSLITSCQNRVNKSVFEMSGGVNLRAARVVKISADGTIFTMASFGNAPMPEIKNDTLIRSSRPLTLVTLGQGVAGSEFALSTAVLERKPVVPAELDDDGNPRLAVQASDPGPVTAENEFALKETGASVTGALSGASCDELSLNPVSTDCFDIYTFQNIADVWDTIDDANASAFYSAALPDSGSGEPFLANLCGTTAGVTSQIANWSDNTLDNDGVASTCAATTSNCSLKDLTTGLTWFKGDGLNKSWYEAVYYCSTLLLAGKSWRLPTQKELMTAYVDTIRYTVANGTVSNYNLGWWSSTTDSASPHKGWLVNLASGATASTEKYKSVNKALCVRDPE